MDFIVQRVVDQLGLEIDFAPALDRRDRMRWAVLAPLVLLLAACGGDDGGPQEPVDEGSPPEAGCTEGTLESGALSLICFPETWNGKLVIYAHGYVEPSAPVALPDDEVGGVSISDAVTGFGYAYATTSYRDNGLVVLPAIEDVTQLVEAVRARVKPDPTRTLLVGFSEGGLVAALTLERHPELIDGALAACGPIGDFTRQIDYFGDARVLFDYYFPGVLPGTAVGYPAPAPLRLDQHLRARGHRRAHRRPRRARPSSPPSRGFPCPTRSAAAAATIAQVLWYNVFATEDAQERLGGNPYTNVGPPVLRLLRRRGAQRRRGSLRARHPGPRLARPVRRPAATCPDRW